MSNGTRQRSHEASNVPQVEVKWYHDYVKENIPDLAGKVGIVTGSNSGTGYWAARALAFKNCTVILACRDLEKAKAAKEEILEDFHKNSDGGKTPVIDCIQLDNMDFESVRSFADEFNKRYDRLDFLLNNAGIMAQPKKKSKDGHDVQLQTNHLAHFLLTKLLWQKMLNTEGKSMVVHHSSSAHSMGSPAFDKDHLDTDNSYSWGLLGLNAVLWNVLIPIFSKGQGGNWLRYGVSKLCNVLFMKELSRKIEAKGLQDKISTAACHPGFASTQLQYNARDSMPGWHGINKNIAQSAADGSLPLLMAAIKGENGKYYGPKDYTKGPPAEEKVGGNGNDEKQASDLWEYSESVTGVSFHV